MRSSSGSAAEEGSRRGSGGTGLGHLAITALLLGRPAPPAAETAVLGAMRAHRVSMMGLSRDLLGTFWGFSVAMGLVVALLSAEPFYGLALCGAALLAMATRWPNEGELDRILRGRLVL